MVTFNSNNPTGAMGQMRLEGLMLVPTARSVTDDIKLPVDRTVAEPDTPQIDIDTKAIVLSPRG